MEIPPHPILSPNKKLDKKISFPSLNKKIKYKIIFILFEKIPQDLHSGGNFCHLYNHSVDICT